MSNLCSRGIVGCKHDEDNEITAESVLYYFGENEGYVISRNMYSYFGCCTEERMDALITVLVHLRRVTKEIAPVSSSSWGLVGVDHPKIKKQKTLTFKEMPPGKVHLVENGVMIHDRDGELLYEYATTEDPEEVTCGQCKNILESRRTKALKQLGEQWMV